MAGAPIPGTPGDVYQREMVPAIFARWAPDLIELAGLRPGERGLDVACGTGVVTRLAAERVGPTGKVTGLDLNPAMLGAARAQAAPPTVEWVEGSALAVPLPDGSVDAVLCQQGLQFFPDRAAALGALAEQGPDGLDTLAEEVSAALRSWLDDDGLAFPQISHVVVARR